MLRLFVTIVAAVLLVGSPAGTVASPADAGVAAPLAATTTDGCCPDDDAGVDCCDGDLGACCATGAAATPAVEASPGDGVLTSPAPVHDASAFRRHLQPRDTGPPPTPPPIG